MVGPVFQLTGGIQFPAIGLGTFTVTDESELERAIDIALENGYRHIDTAFLYKNEHIVGKTLKKWFDAGKLKREDIFITTKLPGAGVHPDRVEKYLDQSLNSLQLTYTDLYLIHFPVCLEDTNNGFGGAPEPTDLIAVWKKLEEQVKKGKCRAIGVSNFNQEQVSRIIKNSTIKPAANQVELHVYLQQPGLVKFCQDNNVVMISYFSLGNPGLGEWMKQQGRDQKFPELRLMENDVVKKVADKHKKSVAQVLLKFLLQKNIAIIPKSTNEKRLKENIDLFDFGLDQEDMKVLESLDQGEARRKAKREGPIVDHPEYPWK